MNTVDLRQKLHDYIEIAPDRKIEALYTLVEDETENTDDLWEDEEFVNELVKEEQACLNGTVKTYSLQEINEMAEETIKNIRQSKSERS